jgi:hypothetical protein
MDERGLSRLVMVITSQWPAGGDSNRLDFLPPADWQPGTGTVLPEAARLPVELYEQFLDPKAGACDPVPELAQINGIVLHEPGSSLVVNPTRDVAEAALVHAFDEAKRLDRVLLVHYIGHGIDTRAAENDPPRHRLLLVDSEATPQTKRDAWDPYDLAEELLKSRHLPGFVFLVDACQASSARTEVKNWSTTPSTHVWMGASQATNAYDGCFSATLCDLMRQGDLTRSGPRPVPELHSRHVRPLIDSKCIKLDEPDPKIQQADDVVSLGNDYTFITRNRAVEAYEADLGLEGSTRDRLRAAVGEDYQVIDVAAIDEALADEPFVVVTGRAGSGKTALAAALRDPPEDLHVAPVDAIAFLESSSTVADIARLMQPQLAKTRRYEQLLNQYERQSQPDELDKQDAYQRYLAGPMSLLSNRDKFTVCLDGLDQLATEQQQPVLDAYFSLIEKSDGRFQVLATSRPKDAGGPIPDRAHIVEMPPLSPDLARRYLHGKGIKDSGPQDDVLNLTDDLNWLVLTLAAHQLVITPDAELSSDISVLYGNIVDAAIADLGEVPVKAVVDVLAACGEVAGVGPRLPFAIFAPAVEALGGPADLGAINRVLSHRRLYSIIERSNPATDNEHLGLFHLTAIEALSADDQRRKAAHGAITDVLDEIMDADVQDDE